MAIGNYGELRSAVAGWLDREDLTARIPDFIHLGQARLRRELKGLRGTQGLVIDAGSVDLPDGVNTVRAITLDGRGPLQLVTAQRYALEQGRNRPPMAPAYAYVVPAPAGGGTVYVTPVPDQSYQATIEFEERLAPFTSDSGTDSVLQNDPDLYLYSALVESAPYLKDDERAGIWETRLQVALGAFKAAQDRRSFPNTPRMRARRVMGE